MKISDTTLQSQMHQAVSARRTALSQLQISIASGVKYVRRSENPADTAAASTLERTSAQNQQWQDGVDHALSWTRITEGHLTQVVDLMHRADELAVQAADATSGESDRAAIASEINALLENLAVLANTRYQGAHLFGGTYSDQPPIQISRDASGDIISATPAVANIPLRSAQVDQGTTWTYGAAAAGDHGLFVDSVSGTHLFQALVNLRDELRAGNMPSPTAKQDIEAGRNHAIAQLVEVGVSQQRYEFLAERHDRSEVELTQRLSDLTEVDLARALTELSQLETTFQATLQMASRMNQLTFANFL
jgi:flagellar hook-associated protein 3 FlgL